MLDPNEVAGIIEKKKPNIYESFGTPWIFLVWYLLILMGYYVAKDNSFLDEGPTIVIFALLVIIVQVMLLVRVREKIKEAKIYSLLGQPEKALKIALKYFSLGPNKFNLVELLIEWIENLIDEERYSEALPLIKSSRSISEASLVSARLLVDEAICHNALGSYEAAKANVVVAMQQLKNGKLMDKATKLLEQIDSKL